MTIRILTATTAAAVLLAPPAQASCLPSTERERLRRADAVFTGRVLSVSRDGSRATFRVLRVRKGRIEKGTSVRVRAEPYPSSATISWRPRRGQRWRLFVDRRQGRWATDDCMGTRRL